jgi:phosphoribosylcarboxyaminoimidazole (NCAIR) mutase
MKKSQTVIKELRKELHYWQMRVRMDIKSLHRTQAKCKEIAAQMRKEQMLCKRS